MTSLDSSMKVSDNLLKNTVVSYLLDWIDRNTIIEWFQWEHRERVIIMLSNIKEENKIEAN